jgi:arabinoxylan arabinofuranohydrolase
VTERSTGQKRIGVAVADSPTGPFRDAIGRPLVGNGQIDPTVLIDDDGQAYLYWGNPDLWYVRLNADMTSYPGSPVKIPLTTAGFGTRTGDAARPTLFGRAGAGPSRTTADGALAYDQPRLLRTRPCTTRCLYAIF